MDCSVPAKHPKQLAILVGIQKDCYENAKRRLQQTVQERTQRARQRTMEQKLKESRIKKRLLAKSKSTGPTPLSPVNEQLGVAGTQKNHLVFLSHFFP